MNGWQEYRFSDVLIDESISYGIIQPGSHAKAENRQAHHSLEGQPAIWLQAVTEFNKEVSSEGVTPTLLTTQTGSRGAEMQQNESVRNSVEMIEGELLV